MYLGYIDNTCCKLRKNGFRGRVVIYGRPLGYFRFGSLRCYPCNFKVCTYPTAEKKLWKSKEYIKRVFNCKDLPYAQAAFCPPPLRSWPTCPWRCWLSCSSCSRSPQMVDENLIRTWGKIHKTFLVEFLKLL
jgi:hypothetical protein